MASFLELEANQFLLGKEGNLPWALTEKRKGETQPACAAGARNHGESNPRELFAFR